jgi:hypothetical protein
MKGKIISIDAVENFLVGNQASMNGSKGARFGFSGMMNALSGGSSMDGYKVKTSEHEYLLLIDNGQSCCESFGYFSSNDNLQDFIGAELLSVEATDTSLSTEPVEEIEYLDERGVQFVTFKTDKGDFQIAVYNSHNGYYGHGIIFAEDDKILISDTL